MGSVRISREPRFERKGAARYTSGTGRKGESFECISVRDAALRCIGKPIGSLSTLVSRSAHLLIPRFRHRRTPSGSEHGIHGLLSAKTCSISQKVYRSRRRLADPKFPGFRRRLFRPAIDNGETTSRSPPQPFLAHRPLTGRGPDWRLSTGK